MPHESVMADAMNNSTSAAELRRKAEEKVALQRASIDDRDARRLLHELQVHQIELEMQNDELRQAREEAVASLEKYTDLYDFAPVGYVTFDRNGAIRTANLTAAGLIGVERSKLAGCQFKQFLSVVSRPVFSAFLGKIFTSTTKENCQVEILKEGTSELFVQIEGVADASGEECRIALIDITNQKRAEKVLDLALKAEEALRLEKEAQKALELAEKVIKATRLAKESTDEAARIKSMFFTNMSHELRTPMTGILGMLQLALNENLAPAPRHYLESSLRSAQSLLWILNDILDMSKINAEKLTIEDKPFSPQECLTEAVNIFMPILQSKGLDFVISMAEDVPETVFGDRSRLLQVLLNLIGNAIKFTEIGKVKIRVMAGSMTFVGKRELTFVITDTGIGIPEDKKNLLFQAFSQVDASNTRSYGGTGLGLSICRRLCN